MNQLKEKDAILVLREACLSLVKKFSDNCLDTEFSPNPALVEMSLNTLQHITGVQHFIHVKAVSCVCAWVTQHVQKSHDAPFAFIALCWTPSDSSSMWSYRCSSSSSARCSPAPVAPLSPLTGSASQKITMDKGPLWPQLWAVRVSNFIPLGRDLKREGKKVDHRLFDHFRYLLLPRLKVMVVRQSFPHMSEGEGVMTPWTRLQFVAGPIGCVSIPVFSQNKMHFKKGQSPIELRFAGVFIEFCAAYKP